MDHPQIREIHIDADEVGDEFLQAVGEIGFYKDDFVRCCRTKTIPHHWTWQIIGPRAEVARKQQEVYTRLVTLAQADDSFVGYIEVEVIDFRSGHQIKIPWHEYDPKVPFRFIRPLELVLPKHGEHKTADVHCKVPLSALHPMLEVLMATYNICYVDTPKDNRIYTLQFLSKDDSLLAYDALCLYFMAAGGVVEITYEVCPNFFRKPNNLTIPLCVKEGSLAHLASTLTI